MALSDSLVGREGRAARRWTAASLLCPLDLPSPREEAGGGYGSEHHSRRGAAMKRLATWLVVVAGMLTADAALAQDFRSQAATAGGDWVSGLSAGGASTVAQPY